MREYSTPARIFHSDDAEVARPERFELPTFWFVGKHSLTPKSVIYHGKTPLRVRNISRPYGRVSR